MLTAESCFAPSDDGEPYMTSRRNQPSRNLPEASAARLARRLEREARIRAERKRTVIIMASLACAGALLLGIGGIAMAARAGGVPSGQAQATAAALAPVSTPTAAPEAVLDDTSGDTEPVVIEPADPPVKAAPEPTKQASKPPKKKAASGQRLSIEIGDAGYEPTVVRASSGSPITLTVGKGEGCAAGFVMPSLGISKDNSNGPVTFSLGELEPGTYRFACAMEMVEGQLVVE